MVGTGNGTQTGDANRAGRERLRLVALALIVMSLVGFLLSWVFEWPSQFVIDEEGADATVSLADFVSGTVASIPLPPFVLLVAGTVLVRRRDVWGTGATTVLTLLGVVFIIGGVGEITSDNPEVPTAVLLLAGLAYVIGGLVLLLSGVNALRLHRQTARQAPSAP